MRFAMSLIVAVALGAGAAYPAAASSRLDRPGTTALGGGGGYGLVTGKGRYGLDFEGGGSYHITLKYMVAPRWAIGFRFENQSFAWKDGLRDEDNVLAQEPYDNLTLTTFEADIYFYRARNEDASPYFMAGIGVYRPELRRPGTDTTFPGENLMTNLGLGVELFLRENWALDLSARGVLLYGRGYAPEELTRFTDYELDQVEGTAKASFGGQIQAGLLYFLTK